MRKKEGLADYRYFPEPDLPEVVLTNEFVDNLHSSLPELPEIKRRRYEKMGLSMQDVLFLADDIQVNSLNLTEDHIPMKKFDLYFASLCLVLMFQ